MRTSATLTTFKCNACGKEHTFAGNTPSIDARLAGWETEAVILGQEVDLCPECVTEIKEFIHYDEPDGGSNACEDSSLLAFGEAHMADTGVGTDDPHGDINGGLT